MTSGASIRAWQLTKTTICDQRNFKILIVAILAFATAIYVLFLKKDIASNGGREGPFQGRGV